MKMVIPDGSKVKELRQTKGLMQKELAHKTMISERLLREIENRNKAVPPFKLVNLATQLGTTAEQIQQKPTSGLKTNTKDAKIESDQLQLREITAANELVRMTKFARNFDWQMDAEPDTRSAQLMEDLLKIVKRIVDGETNETYDEYDREHLFPEIFRQARLKELIDGLRQLGIHVVANNYLHASWLDEDEEKVRWERRLSLAFVPASQKSLVVWIDPGLVKNPKTGKYQEYLPF